MTITWLDCSGVIIYHNTKCNSNDSKEVEQKMIAFLFLDVLSHEQACNLQTTLQMALVAGWSNLRD